MECLPRTIKERRKISLLPDIYSDTLDTDFSVDVPVRRMALLSTLTFDVPVRPMDAKGLKIEIRSCLVTTRNEGAGEGETTRPRERCWSPGGIVEPGGWRATRPARIA